MKNREESRSSRRVHGGHGEEGETEERDPLRFAANRGREAAQRPRRAKNLCLPRQATFVRSGRRPGPLVALHSHQRKHASPPPYGPVAAPDRWPALADGQRQYAPPPSRVVGLAVARLHGCRGDSTHTLIVPAPLTKSTLHHLIDCAYDKIVTAASGFVHPAFMHHGYTLKGDYHTSPRGIPLTLARTKPE